MMNTPEVFPIPPQPRHEEERAHKKKEHEEEQPRATDEAGQVRANVTLLICAPAESNPRSDRNRQAHEPGTASARGTASVSEPWSLFRDSFHRVYNYSIEPPTLLPFLGRFDFYTSLVTL